jgi:O-antigen ligase
MYKRQLGSFTILFLVFSLFLSLPSLIDPIVFPRFLLVLIFSLLIVYLIPWLDLFSTMRTFGSFKLVVFSLPLLFIILVGCNALLSKNLGLALFGTFGRNLGFLHYLSLTILFYLGVYLSINDKHFVRRLAYLFYYSILPISILGIMQHFGFQLYQYNNSYNKVIATFGNPNYLSQYLALACTSFLYFYNRKKYRKLTYTLMVITISVLVLNESIQGPFALIVTWLIVLLVRQTSKKIAVLALALSSLVPILVWILIQSGSDFFLENLRAASVNYRINYLLGALKMFSKNPLFGSGVDNFETAYVQVLTQGMVSLGTGLPDNAHGILFQVLGTQGLMSAAIVTSFFGASIVIALKNITCSQSLDERFFISVLVIVFIFTSQISIESQPTSAVGWVSLGVLHGMTVESVLRKSGISVKKQALLPRSKFTSSHLKFLPYNLFVFLVIISSSLRFSDYLMIGKHNREAKSSSVAVLSVFDAKASSPIGSLWLPDSRVIYEIALNSANKDASEEVSLTYSLALVDYILTIFPDDVRSLDLKSQILSAMGKDVESESVKSRKQILDPFGVYKQKED